MEMKARGLKSDKKFEYGNTRLPVATDHFPVYNNPGRIKVHGFSSVKKMAKLISFETGRIAVKPRYYMRRISNRRNFCDRAGNDER